MLISPITTSYFSNDMDIIATLQQLQVSQGISGQILIDCVNEAKFLEAGYTVKRLVQATNGVDKFCGLLYYRRDAPVLMQVVLAANLVAEMRWYFINHGIDDIEIIDHAIVAYSATSISKNIDDLIKDICSDN